MTASKEDMKQEAVKRMECWGLYPETIRQFAEDNLVSESTPPQGAIYPIGDKQREQVNDFEARTGSLVYHIIRNYTAIGELWSFLFVSNCKEDWDYDAEDQEAGLAMCYIYSCDHPDRNSIRQVGIEPTPAEGLQRTE